MALTSGPFIRSRHIANVVNAINEECIMASLHFLNLLPRCYQDRTNQRHLDPLLKYPDLLFLVGLDRLRCIRGNS